MHPARRVQVGPWELHSGDPFGDSHGTADDFGATGDPGLSPHGGCSRLISFPIAVRWANTVHCGQPVQAATVDSMSVRGYQHGDSLRHIHWPTTARQNAPFVKVFQPEAASKVWILPDLDPAAQWGEGADSTEETTILLAASLAAEMLHQKLAVGIFAGGNPGKPAACPAWSVSIVGDP